MPKPLEDQEARDIIDRHDALKTERARVEPEWDAMAQFLSPRRRRFSGAGAPGEWTQRGIYNSLPIVYRDQLTTHVFSTMMNPANEWMALTIQDEELRNFAPVRGWLDTTSTLVLGSFNPRASSFYSNALPLLADDVTFGQAVQYDEFDHGRDRILDRTLPLDQCVFAIDEFGQINEMMWRFEYTAGQAERRFGRAGLPEGIIERADKGDIKTKFWFILSVADNKGFIPGRMGRTGKPWASVYVAEEARRVVAASGFFDMPFTAPRWHVDTGETYGRGQAWAGFASVRLINRQEEAVTRAGQMAAKPALLVSHERVLGRGRTINPGAKIYGGLAGGRAQVAELTPGAGTIGITLQHQQQKLDEVREAFHGALFNLTGRTGMTPQEWFDQHAAMLRRIAPHITRLQDEYLVPKIERRFNMLQRAGALPPPPQELDGVGLDIDYLSASSLAQRSGDGAATVRLLQDLGPLAALGQRAQQRIEALIDPDAVAEVLQAARGVPARVLRSREDADAITERDARAAQLAQLAEMAPGVAGAAKDAAEAREVAAG